MDWVAWKSRLIDGAGKYKYVLLILALGIFLMVLPESSAPKSSAEPVVEPTVDMDVAERLTEILGQIQGVGKVKVMVTESAGAETIYQTNDDLTQAADTTTTRFDTVIVSDDNGEQGLIKTVTPPVYLGAIIVCQGGGDPTIRLAIVQAVSAVTGIGTDRITVLKMK